jgi:hypothetical protein
MFVPACSISIITKLIIYLPGIGETDWAFKTTFEVTESELQAPHADLVFEGLDTYATVELVCYSSVHSTIPNLCS